MINTYPVAGSVSRAPAFSQSRTDGLYRLGGHSALARERDHQADGVPHRPPLGTGYSPTGVIRSVAVAGVDAIPSRALGYARIVKSPVRETS